MRMWNAREGIGSPGELQPTWSETRTLAGFRETESVTAETALTCRYVTRRERVVCGERVRMPGLVLCHGFLPPLSATPSLIQMHIL